jgi:hypothetical protein
VRIYAGAHFLGLGRCLPEGRIAPARLVAVSLEK